MAELDLDEIKKKKFNISVENLITIGAVVVTVVGMWYSLQADINQAKELPIIPPPDVSRMEFDMKDQMIRQTIITTQEDVTEIKKTLEKIEEKIYE